jgi:hypothetical protein
MDEIATHCFRSIRNDQEKDVGRNERIQFLVNIFWILVDVKKECEWKGRGCHDILSVRLTRSEGDK